MFKMIALLMIFFSRCSLFALLTETTDACLEIGTGYRLDKLEYKTSYDYDSKYELQSHLKWDALQIWQIGARGQYLTSQNIYLGASADYGWIMSGKNTDHDHGKCLSRRSSRDDSGYSSFEIAHSHSKTKGHVYDGKIAIGYQFQMCRGAFAFTPLIGYSWHGQNLQDYDLKQKFYGGIDSLSNRGMDNSYSTSSDEGTNARYHAEWRGPFLGFDFDYHFGLGCAADWEFFGAYEFHWTEYRAKAQWNLREDFVDSCFYHRAKNCCGNVFNFGVKWNFCGHWAVALRTEFQWFWADRGSHRVKVSHASVGERDTDCYLSMRLRNVSWHSAAVTADLEFVF